MDRDDYVMIKKEKLHLTRRLNPNRSYRILDICNIITNHAGLFGYDDYVIIYDDENIKTGYRISSPDNQKLKRLDKLQNLKNLGN